MSGVVAEWLERLKGQCFTPSIVTPSTSTAHSRSTCRREPTIGVGPELNLPDHPEVYGLDDIAAITDATHQRSGRITTRDEEA